MHTQATENKMSTDAVVTRVVLNAIGLSNGAVINRSDIASATEIKVGDRVRRTGDRWALMEIK